MSTRTRSNEGSTPIAEPEASGRTVVVGHGMVGHRFVESLRRRDPDGSYRVVVLAEESRPAYGRVALSSYLGEASEAELALADEEFLADDLVDLHLDDRAVDVDRTARVATTAGAEAKDPSPAPVAAAVGPVDAAAWTSVCPLERIQPERAVGALVAGAPVAVVRTHDDRVFALHDVDPFSGTPVLARGIVGDVDGRPVIVSPLFKQHFALDDGRSLEDDGVAVATYSVQVTDGVVQVGHP